MTLWIYAVTSSPARTRFTGMTGEPIRFVRVDGAHAAVGEMARRPRPSMAMLERYDAVIRQLAGRCASVLPAQFGTFVTGDDELEFILRSRAPRFARALRQVRNRVQMTIRVMSQPGASASVGKAGPHGPPAADRSSGGSYLRSKAAAAARERVVPGFDGIQKALTRWVRDERVDKRGAVTTVYHLIPRAAVPAYERALRHAATDSDLRFALSGPFPPYAFTDGEA